ncbi:hypothetical protein Tco_0749537, partial [Tanacetum coccineum]
SEGFEQIVDFQNANPIRYALTINPTIYTSCIEQFWATVNVKTVNGEVQLQALVDGKKIIISESTVRRDLQLEDAEGVDCLPNAIIFEHLTLMGMVKNLDNVGKFLMYPRVVQVFLDKQVDGMESHKRIYIAPSHTKKIFRNMRRVGKDFSRRETPLLQTMVVQDHAEMGEGSGIHTDPHHTPTFIQPLTSQPQMKQRSRRPKRKDTRVRAATTATSLDAEHDRGNINKTRSKATLNEPSSPGTSSGSGPRCQETIGDTIAQTRFENVFKHSNDPLLVRGNTLQSGEDRLKLKELMELCTNLQTRVLDLETTKTTQANKIAKDASKQGRIANIDATKYIYLVNVHHDEDMFGVNDPEGDEVLVKSEGVVKNAKERINVVEEVADISTAATIVKQEELTDEEKARLFVQFLEQRRKHFAAKRAEEKRNIPPTRAQQRSIMSGEELEQESSKKQKLEEDKEFEELKKYLEIVLDDGDDVTIDATPLSTRSPTIIDYKIYKEGKKSYFQIIRADGNSQMYLTFGKMVKNFNKEDLEVLWSIVKARFMKTEPVNYMDNFLLLNLKTMFEHHVEDNVWKNQHGLVKELNWKLYDSCGVHCVKWHLSFLDWSRNSLRKDMYLNEVFGSILLVIDEALDET